MKRIHALLISAAVAFAVAAGTFAALRTTQLGSANSPGISPTELTRQTRALDRTQAQLKRALHKQPPKLPPVPVVAAPAPVTTTAPTLSAPPPATTTAPAPTPVAPPRAATSPTIVVAAPTTTTRTPTTTTRTSSTPRRESETSEPTGSHESESHESHDGSSSDD